MASTPYSYILLLVIGTCSIFLEDLVVEGNNQPPSDSTIEGQGSSFFFYQNPEYPRDCSEVRDSCPSSSSSGVYLIKPDDYKEPFEVYCDNEIDSGGWTVILRRFDGSVDFSRQWSDYKKGFGFLSTEFWLGNDKLSYLTNQALYELRIDITLGNGTTCDVKYDAFRISDEWSGYKLSTLGTFESDAACRWKEDECDTPEGCEPGDVSTNFTDCTDVYNAGNTQDGVYYIRPAGWNDLPFKVFCNMSFDGGKWTVFQRRVNGSTNFYRNWTEYRNGFGDIQHEFWLGNEKLHYLTQQANYEYRVDFVRSSHVSYYNKYTKFQVDNEENKYSLADVGTRTGSSECEFKRNFLQMSLRRDLQYFCRNLWIMTGKIMPDNSSGSSRASLVASVGTLGYSLYNIQNTPFSTYDEDNDGQSYDCAVEHRSGWWHGASVYIYSYDYCVYFPSGVRYIRCSYANLNGDYNGGNGENIFDSYTTYNCNQKYTEMKIRRIS